MLLRFDSPLPSATRESRPVSMSTMRASSADDGLALFVAEAADADLAEPAADAADARVLGVVAELVMLPTMMASTPSSLPILAAEFGSARSLFEKFCSARILSSALRSITE